MFEGKSIKNFNADMFLDELKKEQTEGYFQIVCFRWKAIQKYYMGDIKRSVEELEAALHLAKEMDQPSWMIKDILIDLRNLNNMLCMIRNEYTESEAQKELSQSDEEVYYPLMDRLHNSLHEKYMEGLKKEKIQSPYSVNLGHNFAGYAELLVSGLVIAMYNGSLTHILLFYEEMQEFMFYLCCKFDNLSFRFDMLKLTIYSGKEKEVKNILDSYPEILNNMDAKRAADLFRNYERIEAFSGHFALTNISEISLKIGLNLLYTAMGKDVYIELLELMPYIQNDTATTISVTKTIVDYLEISESVVYPPKIESIILQNTIQWIHSDYLDVRWNAVRILFFLLRNPENEGIINHQLINLVDSDNVYIKNLIMRNILHTQGISEASKQYIMKKCHEDPNYVVRFVCQDLRNKEHFPNDIEI